MKNKKRYIIMITSFILFIVLAIIIKVTDNNIIDEKIYNFISNNLIKDNMTPLIKIITSLASAKVLIIITIILIIIIRNKRISISVLINLISSFLLNNLLKIIFKRPRPSIYNIIIEKGYSFPSGHSMVSCAYYGFLIYLIYIYIDNKKLKYFLITLLSLIIILIGISRIYLGVHYTTDVLGGYLFSIFYLIIYINIIEKYLDNKDKK